MLCLLQLTFLNFNESCGGRNKISSGRTVTTLFSVSTAVGKRNFNQIYKLNSKRIRRQFRSSRHHLLPAFHEGIYYSLQILYPIASQSVLCTNDDGAQLRVHLFFVSHVAYISEAKDMVVGNRFVGSSRVQVELSPSLMRYLPVCKPEYSDLETYLFSIISRFL